MGAESDKVAVSIIVPNYNHLPYLEKRLETIFNQTFQDFEVLLLDDASNDGSAALLERYKAHSKVSKVVLNTENSGSVYKQWSKGIALAQGEYIWLAESDDYADVRFLEATVPFFEKQEDLGMIFTDTLKVDSQGVSLGLVSESKSVLRDLSLEGGIINQHNVARYLLEKMVVVNASSVVFRKAALQTLDFDLLSQFKNTGDVFTYMHVAMNHNLLFLNKPLNFMRLHPSNTTKKGKKSGALYSDKISLLDCYLPNFKTIENAKRPVLNFFYGLFFFSIDHGLYKNVKQLGHKLIAMGYVGKPMGLRIQRLAFLYTLITYQGRPAFLRERFKKVLRKTLGID